MRLGHWTKYQISMKKVKQQNYTSKMLRTMIVVVWNGMIINLISIHFIWEMTMKRKKHCGNIQCSNLVLVVCLRMCASTTQKTSPHNNNNWITKWSKEWFEHSNTFGTLAQIKYLLTLKPPILQLTVCMISNLICVKIICMHGRWRTMIRAKKEKDLEMSR